MPLSSGSTNWQPGTWHNFLDAGAIVDTVEGVVDDEEEELSEVETELEGFSAGVEPYMAVTCLT